MDANAVEFSADASSKGANLVGASIVLSLKSFDKAPDSGMRLARIIAKKDKEGSKDLAESKGVIVPDVLTVADCAKFPSLNSAMVKLMQDWQNDLIKSLIVAGETQIQHAAITAERLAAHVASESESLGRLTEAEIKNWYEANKGALRTLYATTKGKESLTETETKQADLTMVRLYGALTEKAPVFQKESTRDNLRLFAEACDSHALTGKILAKLAKAEIVSDDI